MRLTRVRICKEGNRIMDETKNVIISAKDIEVKFRVRDKYLTAIRNVSLDLYEGETFAIVGESGSGKSVFTKTFTGMLESNGTISNGSVMFHGTDLTKLRTDKDWEGIRGAKISTIFQDPMTSLNPIRTIGSQITEVIEKHQKISKAEAKQQAIEMMDRVGIPDAANRFDEYPFQYSGGMRQRIVIAIALSCHPEILICDEPTTALGHILLIHGLHVASVFLVNAELAAAHLKSGLEMQQIGA